ncbi:protein transparent testa 12 [Phtheirospermum japonicum]|uniref:Protein transparent testa 12 n=1 Tax=Phtheirospermum japonicum TaxID=374723 RepID=A0A830BU50_9LAMI|nr:protein transparent testa 12 [Phtheirospermum japonicum]
MPMPLTLKFLLIFIFSSYFFIYANSTVSSKKIQNFTEPTSKPLNASKKLQSLGGNKVLLRGNTTITSVDNTFKLGFFTPNDEFSYFGIWYASIPIPTYVWVANREKPIKNLPSASAEINQDGKLALMDQESRTLLWETNNIEKASDLKLLEQGNLVLLSSEGRIVWQSFDSPTDTWLPGMNLTADQKLTSWRSSIDPSPGSMNLNGWEGMLFIGVNAAISVRVSNELGSGHPRAAKYSVFVTVVESLLIGLMCMVIIIATKDHFAIIFTNSDKMQKAVAELAYLLAVTMVLNSIQPVISGVAIGGGWQGLVAYINLTCYYVIGLPIGFVLGYKTNLGVQGIWMGMIFGTFLQTVILLIIVWRTNWNEEVAQASERMRKWGGETVDY